ncbi:MAG: hypothetical protein ACI8XB_002219 [Patiriisocius sp.]|jgi:hypothetical protein
MLNIKSQRQLDIIMYRIIAVFIISTINISIQAQDAIFTNDGKKYDCTILEQDNIRVNIKSFLLGSSRTTYIPLNQIDTLILGYKKNIISDATIFKANGETIVCHIESKDDICYYFHKLDNRENSWSYINIAKVDTVLYSQSSHFLNQRTDESFISMGIGLDHGGIGIQVGGNVSNGVYLFGGIGYALIGIGANVGTKIQLKSEGSSSKTIPFLEGMYGYNAVIAVKNASGLNKAFYGPSFGGGLDFYSNSGNFFSLGILVPIRGEDVDDYIQSLKRNYGVVFENDLPPIALSLGYGFSIK